MANTYTQLQIQVVIIVKRRAKLIDSSWKHSLYAYMTGIIQHYDHKVLIINGIEDHVHLFIVMKPTQSLSDLMKQVKQDSSQWVNKQGFTKTKFSWQSGFGAFAYSKWDVRKIIRYHICPRRF